MPRESQAAKRERLGKIITRLQQTYPDAHCELNYRNPLELMVSTILSAQCTDKQVNIVTTELFKKYRKAADYTAVQLEELQNDIRRIGLFRNKAKSIQNACRALVEQHHGEVPQTMPELVALAGVGRKTANVILGNAFDINEGVVVDTHVARLGVRLRITSAKTPEKIEKDLIKLVPQEHWTLFSHWIIWHGRRRCDARKPDCAACEIRHLCPSAP
jgi:endonuclease III